MAKKNEATKEAPKQEAPKHELLTRVSDNTTTVWVECSCGFETAFYTIVGDGVDAMKAARDEAEQHVNPRPLSEEFTIEADEFPPDRPN